MTVQLDTRGLLKCYRKWQEHQGLSEAKGSILRVINESMSFTVKVLKNLGIQQLLDHMHTPVMPRTSVKYLEKHLQISFKAFLYLTELCSKLQEAGDGFI